MYKIVILDLDGTLLTSDKRISEYTKEIIRKLNKDVKFVLASARAFVTIKPYLKKLGLLNKNNYTIAFNGSLVVNNFEEPIIDEEIENNSKRILQEYIDSNNQVEWHYYTYDKNILMNDIKDIFDFIKNNKIYKIVCLANEDIIIKMRKDMPYSITELFQITSSEPTRIEFVKKGMRKIEAIKLLLKELNINSSEVIAMGDGENDIEMIKYAGCGIAMGNATEEVKSIADIITDTNDNDGVGKILKKIFVKGDENK